MKKMLCERMQFSDKKAEAFLPLRNASVHTYTQKGDKLSSSPPVPIQPQLGAQNTSNCFLASDVLFIYIQNTQPPNYYTLTLNGTKVDAVASRALPRTRFLCEPSDRSAVWVPQDRIHAVPRWPTHFPANPSHSWIR